MNRAIRRACGVLLTTAAAASAHAFSYDETVNGDLSSNRLAPSVLNAVAGTNTLVMSSGTGDRDYLTFAVPAGLRLSSIFQRTYDSTDDLSFIGLQAGTTLTEPPTAANPANLLGYFHFGAATKGTEILDNLAASGSSAPPAMGFTAPLGAGDYTFWIQQLGVPASYAFDFVLTPVPEPAPWALLLIGAIGLAARARGAGRSG